MNQSGKYRTEQATRCLGRLPASLGQQESDVGHGLMGGFPSFQRLEEDSKKIGEAPDTRRLDLMSRPVQAPSVQSAQKAQKTYAMQTSKCDN